MDTDSVSGESVESVSEPEPEATEPAPTRTVVYNAATPSETQWQQETGDKAFGYRNEVEYVPPPKKPEPQEPYKTPWYVKAIDGLIEFLSSDTGKVVLWGILGLLAVYVLYQVITGNAGRFFARRNRKMTAEEGAVLSEDDLLGNNWEERLRLALEAGDMRLAIRYSYLLLLQLLQQRELIAFRNDKTNTDYYRELGQSGADLRPTFRQISRQYEYAWYGNYLPARPTFEEYMKTFTGIKNRLQGS